MSEKKPFYVISEDKLKELIKPRHYTTFKWALRDIKASAVREVKGDLSKEDWQEIIAGYIMGNWKVFVEEKK